MHNKAIGAEQENQREELLTLVQRVLMENDGEYYTHQTYQRAEEEIQKQVRIMQERYRTELEKAKRQIRVEYEEEIRKLQDELAKEQRKGWMMAALAEKDEIYTVRQQRVRDEVVRQSGILEFILDLLEIASDIFSHLFKGK